MADIVCLFIEKKCWPTSRFFEKKMFSNTLQKTWIRWHWLWLGVPWKSSWLRSGTWQGGLHPPHTGNLKSLCRFFSLFFEQLKEHAPNEPLPSGGRFWRVWRSGQSRFWSVLWWFFGFAWRLMFSVPGEFGDCFHKLFPSNDPTEKSQVGLGQANVGPTRWRTACWWADLQTYCETMKKSTQWLEILCKHHAKLEFNVEKNRDCLCCIFAVLLLFEWVKNIFNHPVYDTKMNGFKLHLKLSKLQNFK